MLKVELTQQQAQLVLNLMNAVQLQGTRQELELIMQQIDAIGQQIAKAMAVDAGVTETQALPTK
jgi:phage terminase Nu1 subunit (DNA packaging protein)